MTDTFLDASADITANSKKDGHAVLNSALISKNVRIHDRRTSIRLEPEMWDALNEIAGIESCTIHCLCGAVYDLKEEGSSFTAALRVFLMEYYRSAARTSQQVGLVRRRLQLASRAGGRRARPPVGTGGEEHKITA